MHIFEFEEFFMTKKSKRLSPTTKTIYKRDLTLEMWSLHLYESRILTVWINSSKIRVNDIDFIQNVPEHSVWSYFVKEIGLPIFLYKNPHKENCFSPLKPKLPFLIQKCFQKPSLIICKCSKRLFEHITPLILIIFSKKARILR